MTREIRRRLELDATPEQVWDAVATGPGITGWFVPTEVEPRLGGAVTQDFGSGGKEQTGVVTAYEPGRRFGYGSAFEFLVEGREAGPTVLTFVQSGLGDAAEVDSYATGWDLFFTNLRAALEHFAGERATGVVAAFYADSYADGAGAWPVLLRGLGLAGMPSVGDRVTLAPDGPVPLHGVVDVATREFLGVRSAHGLHRIGAEGGAISAYHYFYGEPVDAGALTEDWQGWLDGLLGPTSPPPSP